MIQDLEIERSRAYRIGRETKHTLKALWWWAVILAGLSVLGCLLHEIA